MAVVLLWPRIYDFSSKELYWVLGVFTSAAPTDKNFIPPRGEGSVRLGG